MKKLFMMVIALSSMSILAQEDKFNCDQWLTGYIKSGANCEDLKYDNTKKLVQNAGACYYESLYQPGKKMKKGQDSDGNTTLEYDGPKTSGGTTTERKITITKSDANGNFQVIQDVDYNKDLLALDKDPRFSKENDRNSHTIFTMSKDCKMISMSVLDYWEQAVHKDPKKKLSTELVWEEKKKHVDITIDAKTCSEAEQIKSQYGFDNFFKTLNGGNAMVGITGYTRTTKDALLEYCQYARSFGLPNVKYGMDKDIMKADADVDDAINKANHVRETKASQD